MKLKPKQEQFCLEYAKNCGNATEAYKAAGYKPRSEKAAGVSASRLLGKASIKLRLDELSKQTTTPKIMTIQRRKEKLTEIAESEESSKADIIKAIDTMNKMDSVYVQRQDVNMSGGVVVLHDDIPTED